MAALVRPAYDGLHTPLLFADLSGRVLYKNKAARKILPHPIAGNFIWKFLRDPSSERVLSLKEDGRERAVCFTDRKGGAAYHAIAARYRFERSECFVFVFLGELQIELSDTLFSDLFRSHSAVWQAVRPVLDSLGGINADEADEKPESAFSHYRKSERTLGELDFSGIGASSPVYLKVDAPIPLMIRYLRAGMNRVLEPHGGRFFVMPDGIGPDGSPMLYSTYQDFVVPIVIAVLKLLPFSFDGSVAASFAQVSDPGGRTEILTTLCTECHHKGVKQNETEEPEDFVRIFPEEAVNLASLSGLCRALGYRISYSLNAGDSRYNLRFMIRSGCLPADSMILKDPNSPFSYREDDLALPFAAMLAALLPVLGFGG